MSTHLPAIIETTPEGHGHQDPALPVTQADTDAQLVDLWVRRHESPNNPPEHPPQLSPAGRAVYGLNRQAIRVC
jgi:hypothetical protein